MLDTKSNNDLTNYLDKMKDKKYFENLDKTH